MRVGDVVIAKSHADPLACGSGIYTHAICVSVDPLVVISEGGDMMWSHKAPYDLVALCEASQKAQANALRRWQCEKEGVVGVADSQASGGG